nr:hypothetical protein [Tanacetum cinerariifolium]
MDTSPSLNHVFNFPEYEEFKENPQEKPEEKPKEELEVNAEDDTPHAATSPVESPITPPQLLESSSYSKVAAPVVANETYEMPPHDSTFE